MVYSSKPYDSGVYSSTMPYKPYGSKYHSIQEAAEAAFKAIINSQTAHDKAEYTRPDVFILK